MDIKRRGNRNPTVPKASVPLSFQKFLFSAARVVFVAFLLAFGAKYYLFLQSSVSQADDPVYRLLGRDTLTTPRRVAAIRAAISARYHDAVAKHEYGGVEGTDWVWKPLDRADLSQGRYRHYQGNTWNPQGLWKEFRELGGHPHVGALDAAGHGGYRHDETALRRNPPEFTYDVSPGWHGVEHGPYARIRTERDACDYYNNLTVQQEKEGRIRVDPQYKDHLGEAGLEMVAERVRVAPHGGEGTRPVRIFCAVYTMETFHHRLDSIRETWAPKCDGFMVASNKTDTTRNTVNIPHFGPEHYNSVWMKVRSIWSYIYKTYYDDYDFFYLGGDDYYLIVENLRTYLSSREIHYAGGGDGWPIPLYLGHRIYELAGGDRWQSNHGGAGYVLNRASLAVLVELAFDLEYCEPYKIRHFEDKKIGGCLRNFTIAPHDTKDRHGHERFHIFAPQQVAAENLGSTHDWYVRHAQRGVYEFGKEAASPESIAFHYVQPRLMKQIHTALYGMCPEME